MLPVLIWIAGLATAAAAASEQERVVRHRALMRALMGRLGVSAEPGMGVDIGGVVDKWRPVEPGVPVWIWEDGHRIVRIVTEKQLELLCQNFSLYDAESDSFMAVQPYDVEPETSGYEEWSIFAYLDELNRAYALLVVDGGIVQALAGSGDDGEIVGEDTIRSRVFQFIQDNDLTDSLESDDLKALWFESVLVNPGIEDIVAYYEARGEGYPAFDQWKAQIGAKYGRDAELYASALDDLWYAWGRFVSDCSEIDTLSGLDPEDYEFWEFIAETDWSWRIEEDGFDPDEVERAYKEKEKGNSSLLDELMENGFDPERMKQIQIEMFNEDIGGACREMIEAAEHEAVAANDMLSVLDERAHRIGEMRQDREGGCKWKLQSESEAARWGRHGEEIEEITLHIPDCFYGKPSWSVARSSSDIPGVLPALFDAGMLETQEELYDLAPEEPVWVWPGDGPLPPAMETKFLLDATSLDPLTTPIDEFVRQAKQLGLLSPDAQQIWDVALGHY